MMWATRTLGELCDDGGGVIRTGPFGSQLHREDYQVTGIPVVMPQDIVDDRISTEKIARISEVDASRLAQHRLAPGDIVYGRRGDLGRHALVTSTEAGWLCGTGCLRISLGEAEVTPEFLHYFLCNPQVIEWIYGQAVGATMPNLNTSILRSIPVTYPPLGQQRLLAEILSAYDYLIENNTRRIAILEEMARAIYREWFVNFRFPGHEQVEMVESELGPVPAGWEIRPIGEVVETMGGGTPSTKNDEFWNDGDVVWFSPSDLTAAGTMFISNSRKKISELGLQKSSAKLFPPYSVMMTSRATIGVTAINTRTACTNQGFITCIPNEALSAYQIYFWISDIKEKIITLASGATFKEINKATFRELPILVPDRRTTKHFTELLSPLGRQIEILQDKNSNLRRTRDLLLPRLISGEIEVGAVEGVLAGAAA